MTTNQRVQELLSEGLAEARKNGFHSHEEGYCAAFLAQRLASQRHGYALSTQPNHKLKRWMQDNPKLVYGVLSDLSVDELADLIESPPLLSRHIIEKLSEAMEDDEAMQDSEHDREPEHDMRDRVNGYRLDYLGV